MIKILRSIVALALIFGIGACQTAKQATTEDSGASHNHKDFYKSRTNAFR